MNIENVVELKRDNLNGIGNRGEKGVILYKLYKLYKPVDGYELMVKLDGGLTEAFLEKDLKLSAKNIDKLNVTW